jgi:hypothetical protein
MDPPEHTEVIRHATPSKEKFMGIDVSITLQDLNCIQQDRGSDGSYPFIWPTLVAINTTNGNVIVVGSEAPSLARVILANGMKSGDSAPIPSTVGVVTRRFDEDLSNFKIIAIVALLEKRDLSDDEILGGYTVFPGALQDGIVANLGGLASTDPTIFQNAINAITGSVHQQVLNAVKARMSGPEQLEYCDGRFIPDSVIDTAHAEISTTSDSTFQLTFGNTSGCRGTIQNGDLRGRTGCGQPGHGIDQSAGCPACGDEEGTCPGAGIPEEGNRAGHPRVYKDRAQSSQSQAGERRADTRSLPCGLRGGSINSKAAAAHPRG